jgi:uncharacterized membrane protein YheB (UPF0754 family)
VRFLISTATYASIVAMCGFVGWITNWLALKMTLYPLRFIGVPPALGWQGIIPRKAAKIAGKAVDLITSRLVAVREPFGRVDPDALVEELSVVLDAATESVVRDVMARQGAIAWEEMPEHVRREIVAPLREETAAELREIGAEVFRNFETFFDLKALVLENLTGPNVSLLDEIFLRCGSKEFKFIELSGLYIGGALGLLQCAIWYVWPRWWLLPVAGGIVGYVTNWVALQMIFRPLEPTRYLIVTYQGMFLRRQDEVSRELADLIATRLVTAPRVVESVVRGAASTELRHLIEERVGEAIDRLTDFSRGALGVLLATMTSEARAETKALARQRMVEAIPACARAVERHLGHAMDLKSLIYPRLRALPKPQFEDILRSCFREDEIILILVGAALGLVVGLAQGLYLLPRV